MNELFVKNNILTEELFEEIERSKFSRIDIQYYIKEEFDKRMIKTSLLASDFVLELEKIIENLTESQIQLVRKKLRDIK